MADAISSNLEKATLHIDRAIDVIDYGGGPSDAKFEAKKARDLIARLIDMLQKEG